MGLHRPKPGEAFKKAGPVWLDPEFFDNYPTIAAHLGDTTWDDGTPRMTSTLLIYVDGGVLTGILNDRANNRSAFVNGESVFSMLVALEDALAAGTIEWRSKRHSPPQQGDTKIPW